MSDKIEKIANQLDQHKDKFSLMWVTPDKKVQWKTTEDGGIAFLSMLVAIGKERTGI